MDGDMSLEDRIYRYTEDARRQLLDRAKKARSKAQTRKGKFQRLNSRGDADVLIDGRTISAKLKSDTYVVQSEDVLVDRFNVIEEKRKKVIGERWKKVWINGKLVIDQSVPILADDEEELDLGPVIVHTSFMVEESEFNLYMDSLNDIYLNLSNIHAVVNLNIFARSGPPPYVRNIFRNSMPQSYDVTAEQNSLQQLFDNFASRTGTVLDITKTNVLESILEKDSDFYQFIDDNYQTLFIELPLYSFHQPASYDSGTSLTDHYNFIENERSVFLITKLDWAWDLGGWPHANDLVLGSESETTKTNDSGTDELYPFAVGYGGSFSRTKTTGSRQSPPTFIHCSPYNVACPPCNCGTGFFGCDYYQIVYYLNDESGGFQCTPYPIPFTIYGPWVRTSPTTRIDYGVYRYDSGIPNNQLYGSGSAYVNSDYSSDLRRFATMRSMLKQAIEEARAAGYLIVVNINDPFLDWRGGSNGMQTPIYSDHIGQVRMYNTFDVIVEMCNEVVFFDLVGTGFLGGSYLLLPLRNDQIDKLDRCTNNAYNFVYNQFGGVSAADFSALKVLYIQPYNKDFFGEWSDYVYYDQFNPNIGAKNDNPLRLGTNRLDALMEKLIVDAQTFYQTYDGQLSAEDLPYLDYPHLIPGQTGKTNYLKYALVSRFFGNPSNINIDEKPFVFL